MMTKQVMLGMGLMIGGGIMLVAMLLQPNLSEPVQAPIPNPDPIQRVESPPLTVDMQTEQQVLEKKQAQREQEMAQAEVENQAFAKEHKAAELVAVQKSQAQEEVVGGLKVQTRPESLQQSQTQTVTTASQPAQSPPKQTVGQPTQTVKKSVDESKKPTPKSTPNQATQKALQKQSPKPQDKPKPAPVPTSHVVKAGDNLIRLSKTYNIPVSVIAEANNMGRHDPLQRGRTIKLPSAEQIKALEQKAQKREQEERDKQQALQKKREINDRLNEARREAKRLGINEGYSVQVTLATDQAKADEVAQSYKKAGYKVKTIKESRGVRVVVGNERSKEAALALKDKINNDSSLYSNGAWITR